MKDQVFEGKVVNIYRKVCHYKKFTWNHIIVDLLTNNGNIIFEMDEGDYGYEQMCFSENANVHIIGNIRKVPCRASSKRERTILYMSKCFFSIE